MIRKVFLFFTLFYFVVSMLITSVFANEEFETSYNVSYQVLPTGKANITQEVSLTNKLSNIYATQYSLTLRGIRIENLQAYDEGGPLKTEIKQSNSETTVVLDFNQQVVGKGKTLKFKLTYTAPDLVEKKGQVWEVNIPRLGEQNSVDYYSLVLLVPKEFNKPAYITPEPVEKKETPTHTLFRFTKNQLSLSGVNAVFGEFQIFDFTIFYHLENSNSSPEKTEIAIPPDTALQKVSYQSLEPPPINVRVDNDGNWLAEYLLTPGQKKIITARGKAKIFSKPQDFFPSPTPENLKNNLLPQKYWEVNNPIIQQKAQELKTPKAIYDFVVNFLEYDFERVKEEEKRMGALHGLNNPQKAICMEFTDLFIALCRAAGIPAREINGFAYTANEKLKSIASSRDILHSWPEYYDEIKKVWIPVDPTWGKTTGGVDYFSKPDLNHFAFVIHGENSETPYPPGSYISKDLQIKNVNVDFGEYEPEKEPNLKVYFELPSQIYWATEKGWIIIQNNGPTAVYDLKIKIEGKGIYLTSQLSNFNLAVLPPFANKKIKVELKPEILASSPNAELVVLLNDSPYSHFLKINLYPKKIILPFLGIILITSFLFFLTKIKFYVKKN